MSLREDELAAACEAFQKQHSPSEYYSCLLIRGHAGPHRFSCMIDNTRARRAEVERQRDEARADADAWKHSAEEGDVEEKRLEDENDALKAACAAMRGALAVWRQHIDAGVCRDTADELASIDVALASDAGAKMLERVAVLEDVVILLRECDLYHDHFSAGRCAACDVRTKLDALAKGE